MASSKLCSSAGVPFAFVAAVVLLAVAREGWAQTSLCNMSEDGMTACRPSISAARPPAPEEKPAEACCLALKQANLTCLCSYKNSDLLPFLGIDPKLAMQLPAKCNIAPPQQC
ncbi:putative lipid-transfer protein DIR1 [Zingiber officinale]|uniref:putative lipid-transfer protein DIR1 n=1 Tax=Zingiber officinale TaxID=94328 RepID=UPI001C4ADF7F|nr:putative lipid-transfer protein DIR1 [Zingiber officinale]